jgi:hypothetical protein
MFIKNSSSIMLVTLTEENGSKKRIVEIGYIQVGKM